MKNFFPKINQTLYGFNRRINYFYSQIENVGKDFSKTKILDVGCGNGELVTLPLANKGFDILGIDLDKESIFSARQSALMNNIPSAKFRVVSVEKIRDQYDVVILSEVLEHVKKPEVFLEKLARLVRPGGLLLLTIPNGYGPFELDQYLWRKNFLFIPALARLISSRRKSKGLSSEFTLDTKAVDCPHVNWFSWRRINRLIAESGFTVESYRPRVFIVGSYSSLLFEFFDIMFRIKLEFLANFNAALSDIVPVWFNSGWMFTCKKNKPKIG